MVLERDFFLIFEWSEFFLLCFLMKMVESPLGGHLEAGEQKQHDLVQCHSSPLLSPKGSSSSHRDASIKRKSQKIDGPHLLILNKQDGVRGRKHLHFKRGSDWP